MILYVKIDINGYVIGHDWNKENDSEFLLSPVQEPRDLFIPGIKYYKYRLVNGKWSILTEVGLEQHPQALLDQRQSLLDSYQVPRRKEYPSIEECIEALMENFEGRPEKLEQVIEKRLAVRQKYPKPLGLL